MSSVHQTYNYSKFTINKRDITIFTLFLDYLFIHIYLESSSGIDSKPWNKKKSYNFTAIEKLVIPVEHKDLQTIGCLSHSKSNCKFDVDPVYNAKKINF